MLCHELIRGFLEGRSIFADCRLQIADCRLHCAVIAIPGGTDTLDSLYGHDIRVFSSTSLEVVLNEKNGRLFIIFISQLDEALLFYRVFYRVFLKVFFRVLFRGSPVMGSVGSDSKAEGCAIPEKLKDTSVVQERMQTGRLARTTADGPFTLKLM